MWKIDLEWWKWLEMAAQSQGCSGATAQSGNISAIWTLEVVSAWDREIERERGCLSQLTQLPALRVCVCTLKFPCAHAWFCTVNTYVCVCVLWVLCVSVSPPAPVCRHAAASSTVIKLSRHRGIALSSSGSCFFPPYTKNNNYSTILVNHKPPRRLCRAIRRERRSSATLGQDPCRDESQTEQFRFAFQA